jgi:hypothetical protein
LYLGDSKFKSLSRHRCSWFLWVPVGKSRGSFSN